MLWLLRWGLAVVVALMAAAPAYGISVPNTEPGAVEWTQKLEADHKYKFVASGAVSDWCNNSKLFPCTAETPFSEGVDPLYCYLPIGSCPGSPEALWRQLRVFGPFESPGATVAGSGRGIDEFAGQAGQIPYSAGHRYEVEFSGVEGYVQFAAIDAFGSAANNSGSFQVEITDLGVVEDDTGCRRPEATVGGCLGIAVNWGVGAQRVRLNVRQRNGWILKAFTAEGSGQLFTDALRFQLNIRGAKRRMNLTAGALQIMFRYKRPNGRTERDVIEVRSNRLLRQQRSDKFGTFFPSQTKELRFGRKKPVQGKIVWVGRVERSDFVRCRKRAKVRVTIIRRGTPAKRDDAVAVKGLKGCKSLKVAWRHNRPAGRFNHTFVSMNALEDKFS